MFTGNLTFSKSIFSPMMQMARNTWTSLANTLLAQPLCNATQHWKLSIEGDTDFIGLAGLAQQVSKENADMLLCRPESR